MSVVAPTAVPAYPHRLRQTSPGWRSPRAGQGPGRGGVRAGLRAFPILTRGARGLAGGSRRAVQTITLAITVSVMHAASEEQLVRFAQVLTDLGIRHGLANLHRAGDGRIIADIAEGMTYLDVARFELEAEAVLQAGLSVILSETETATRLDRGPLGADKAA